jgi:hypothetical protein
VIMEASPEVEDELPAIVVDGILDWIYS